MVSGAGSHSRPWPGQSAMVTHISAGAAESCGLDGREERVKGEEEGIRVNTGAQGRRRQEDATFPRVLWAGQSGLVGAVAVAVPSPAPHAHLALLIKADNVFLCQLQERRVCFDRTLLS